NDHRDLAAGRRLLAEVDRRLELPVGREPQVLLDQRETWVCGCIGLAELLRARRRREGDHERRADRRDEHTSAAHSGTPALRESLRTARPRGSETNPTLE